MHKVKGKLNYFDQHQWHKQVHPVFGSTLLLEALDLFLILNTGLLDVFIGSRHQVFMNLQYGYPDSHNSVGRIIQEHGRGIKRWVNQVVALVVEARGKHCWLLKWTSKVGPISNQQLRLEHSRSRYLKLLWWFGYTFQVGQTGMLCSHQKILCPNWIPFTSFSYHLHHHSHHHPSH